MSMEDYGVSYRSSTGKEYLYETVWDADKLYGCVCDYGYSGFDCSIGKNSTAHVLLKRENYDSGLSSW